MAVTIKLRRDTSTNWASNNPVLALGEPGLETDTRKIKYGDGSTAWTSLAYASGGSGLTNVTDAGYGADVNGKLAVSGGIDMDIGTTLTLEAGTANFSQSTVVFNNATVAGLDNQTVGLDNISNAVYGVDVTGKVAATDGMDVDIGGSITAQGCTVDFSNSTVVFSGATVSGIDANVSTSASQPSNPNSGDVWFDGSTLTMYVYYVDSNSVGAWVEVGGS